MDRREFHQRHWVSADFDRLQQQSQCDGDDLRTQQSGECGVRLANQQHHSNHDPRTRRCHAGAGAWASSRTAACKR